MLEEILLKLSEDKRFSETAKRLKIISIIERPDLSIEEKLDRIDVAYHKAGWILRYMGGYQPTKQTGKIKPPKGGTGETRRN